MELPHGVRTERRKRVRVNLGGGINKVCTAAAQAAAAAFPSLKTWVEKSYSIFNINFVY